MRAFFVASFFLCFLVPSLATVIYYAFIASDQYITEVKFTVRNGEFFRSSGNSGAAGLAAVIQDTQIIANYIHSRSMVERLDSSIGLRQRFSVEQADFLARFNPKKSIEKLTKYWNTMTDVSISMPGGIIVVTVHAFTPKDAQEIAEAIIRQSEILVNEMNARIREDNLTVSEQELARALGRLTRMRLLLESTRNIEGLLDTDKTADAVNTLISTLETDRLRMQQEYSTLRRYVSETAPQVRNLAARIEAVENQINEQRARLTTRGKARAGDEKTLSQSMTAFADLSLQHRISEQQYASAAAAFEIARVTLERQMVYLATFVQPYIPQDSRYPRRVLMIALINIALLAFWGIICGSLTLARNHMA